MSQQPPTRAMRENPDLEQLKRQAKELLDAYRAQEPQAVAEVQGYHRTADPVTLALHDAQFVLARAYGFESWPKLKAHVDGVTCQRLHDAVESGEVETARQFLTRRPELVDAGRGEMRPIHMAILRRDLAMSKLLLEFGADTEGGIWPNRDATGPYVMARERGYDEILEAIREARIQRGARETRESGGDGLRELHRAYRSGSEEAMVAVLDQYPELAAVCPPDGITMLHQAACWGVGRIAKWLLDHGADVNGKCEAGYWHQAWTPLEFAASGAHGEWLFDNGKFQRVAEVLLAHGAQLSPLSAAALGRLDYLEKCSKEELEGSYVLEAAVKTNQLGVLRRLLERGVDPDERRQFGSVAEKSWSAGGPLFQAVILNRIEMARLLLEHGADPNAQVFAAGSAAYRAYESGDPEFIGLMERYGGKLDPGSAAYARQVEMARKMLAGEIDPPIEPNDFSGHTIAEQLLWGGASSRCAEIVKMALERVDWPPDSPRWFWMLWRPLPGHEDLTPQEQADCYECFQLILARCGPHHRASEHGQTMLHEVIARDHGAGLRLATILLDARARLDVRDRLLLSTPLGWACRWGRTEIVRLLLARGADPVEADAEPWARPRAWAERMRRGEIVELLDAAGG